MRQSWTDERLDDLNHRVDEGFKRVDARFDRMDARFDALQRLIVQVGGGMIATFTIGLLGLIATRL